MLTELDAPAVPSLTDHDIYLFKEGTHAALHHKLGCHLDASGHGAHFAVWAPNARTVSVVGDWNGWDPRSHPLSPRWDGSGIWERHVPGVTQGHAYKYRIEAQDGSLHEKADPFAIHAETAPRTASKAWRTRYEWQDADWMASRGRRNALDAPMTVYEMHLGSWRRDHGRLPTYREVAGPLAEYLVHMGFTHVELMPVTEHPFYGSWGYQTTGYFAPTSRYGPPEDFMYLVDVLHQAGIGVILDWVPSHFPSDAHGLALFDGTHLFEHEDPRQGFHPEWESLIFNYGRHEVRAFLLSSAACWLENYHIDGLRVDAVASMLYLDYARKPGEWIPNERGGNENLAAMQFLQSLNESVRRAHPDVRVIAEESTAWPGVSRPVATGGLGFSMKWNMGWMHDNLAFLAKDPVHRRYHHDRLTFSIWYAFTENFVLALSHDEVVHGKGSLLGKMPGDDWQQRANLRLLYGWMWGHPGKKLLFMGGEFGQRREWDHDRALDWDLAGEPGPSGLSRWVADLNRMLREERALHEIDFSAEGFEWVDCCDIEASVASFLRWDRDHRPVLVVCNFTPIVRSNYLVGVPFAGAWLERLNSDAAIYGGSGVGNLGRVESRPEATHGRPQSIALTLPPLGVVFLTPEHLA